MSDRGKFQPLQSDRRCLRLLKMGVFQRRGGAWRFGTNRIQDAIIDRLLAAGAIVRDGDEIKLPAPRARQP